MGRPICGHCGKPYGQRATATERIKWALDSERPAYRGNGRVLNEGTAHKTANRDTIRAVTMISVNPEIRAHQEAQIARAPEESEWVATRTVWDGESWHGGYEPFCTLRCALAYARLAYRRQR